MRIGHGFDLHRLEPGLSLIVGGIAIEHDHGCVAHSDGDVVLHTVTDSLLGAIGAPDIGQLFSDSDPRWKGADSATFLREASQRVKAAGYRLGNLDITIILQRPKLGPHLAAMQERLVALMADDLGASADRVNLKAKTHEHVDAVGEGRAIACHAVVLLEKYLANGQFGDSKVVG